MSNIFQKVGNCKLEAKFNPKSPLAYGKVRGVGKALSDLKDNLGEGENQIDPDSKFGKLVASSVATKDPASKNKKALKNLAKVDEDLRDESYYNKVKELSGADVVMTKGVAKKRKCKKKKKY